MAGGEAASGTLWYQVLAPGLKQKEGKALSISLFIIFSFLFFCVLMNEYFPAFQGESRFHELYDLRINSVVLKEQVFFFSFFNFFYFLLTQFLVVITTQQY